MMSANYDALRERLALAGRIAIGACLSLITAAVCTTPFWLFLLAKHIFGAEGFWQKLVMFIVFGVPLGIFQIVFVVLWAAMLIVIWSHTFEEDV